MTSPLRGGPGAQKEAASPPLISWARRAGYGPAPPASRVLRIALARDSPAGCPGPRRPLRPLGPGRAAGPGLPPALRAARKTPAVADVREHPNPQRTDELASGTHKEENLRYRSQTLESVKHHLKPNRQRSVGPRHGPQPGAPNLAPNLAHSLLSGGMFGKDQVDKLTTPS
jgi:hypothetical protein